MPYQHVDQNAVRDAARQQLGGDVIAMFCLPAEEGTLPCAWIIVEKRGLPYSVHRAIDRTCEGGSPFFDCGSYMLAYERAVHVFSSSIVKDAGSFSRRMSGTDMDPDLAPRLTV